MMDDDIGEFIVLTVIHLQAPLDSGNFHAPVLLSTCARIHSTIIYHQIHITRFAMEYVWLRVQSKTIQQIF